MSATLDGVVMPPPNEDEFARHCTANPEVIEIRDANPLVEWQHKAMLKLLREKIAQDNTTILLGPNVVLDFNNVTSEYLDLALPPGELLLPLRFGRCVTLRGVSGFADQALPNTGNSPGSPTTLAPEVLQPQITIPTLPNSPIAGGAYGTGRTPHSLGPLLNFGDHRSDEERVFLAIECFASDAEPPSDNVRISGFRLEGPSRDQQSDLDIGILIRRCLNIEISNMEIAGWGGQGIRVVDDDVEDTGLPEDGPGQEQPNNDPGERIGRAEQIRIFRNYIHHNQHPSEDGDAEGYGVQVSHGAWAQIYENVFDFNRHAIEAAGDSGGYEAFRNLVLKGGGVHWDGAISAHTHQFDIHGSDDSLFSGEGKGGQAGVEFLFATNSFQYIADNAIYIRGTPKRRIDIYDNVFPHEGLEDDKGADAIKVQYDSDLDKTIFLGPDNIIEYDSYGRYGVCDFDGDGVDDLFLATSKTWWFSSYGEFPWTYLNARTETLDQVRLGYFDDDDSCDVLTAREGDGKWVVSSGGIGPWTPIGPFSIPLNEVVFGRFDPDSPDPRPGATKRTTHLLWRRQNDDQAEWLVSPISENDWVLAGSSSFPMSDLRFGDFTGDGVTDVLAVGGGRWAFSESARGAWTELNPHLSDDVSSLLIADLDNNNIDDLIKLEPQREGDYAATYTWWVSYDGRSDWSHLKTYTFLNSPWILPFAGRFGAAPGGGVLLIDHARIGHFYSEAEEAAGVPTDWTSLFAY